MDDSKLKFDDLSLIQMSHLVSHTLGEKGDEAVILEIINSSSENVTSKTINLLIKNVFKVTIDQTRINSAIQHLKNSNKIYEQNGELLISPKLQGEINKLLIISSEAESSALQEWAKNYEEYNEVTLSEIDRNILFDTINTYIKTVFLRHGATSYSMINSSLDASEAFDLKDIIFSVLSKVPEQFKQGIKDFLSNYLFNANSSINQKAYLNNQVSKAVCYISMVASPEFLSTIVDKVGEITIYLDTSIIYRLLNLQGKERYESSMELIKICKDYNIKLKLFEKSYKELCYSIAKYAREITKYSTPADYDELSYRIRATDNYISTFWNESSRGVSASDFNNKYKNLLPYLNSFNIEIDDQDYSKIFEIKYLTEEFQAKIRQNESTDPTDHKSIFNLEHDAFCMAAVRALQTDRTDNILDAKFVFLTSDRVLIKLQHSKEYRDNTPIAILPSQLMQILCFTKPTTTYFDAFVGFFSSSKIYFGYDLSNSNIVEIVGRVSLYSKDSPEIIADILSNQIVQNVFRSENSDEEAKDAVIHEAIAKELEGLILSKRKIEEEKNNILYEKEEIVRNIKEGEEKRITELEEYRIYNDKILEERDMAIAESDNMRSYYLKSADSYALKKATIHTIKGCLRFIPPFIMLSFLVIAIVPFTSYLVKPILDYFKTSILFNEDTGYSQLLIVLISVMPFVWTGISYKAFREKVPKFKDLKDKYKTEFLQNNQDVTLA